MARGQTRIQEESVSVSEKKPGYDLGLMCMCIYFDVKIVISSMTMSSESGKISDSVIISISYLSVIRLFSFISDTQIVAR